MKIAISASGKNKEDLLDNRFGRCEYFQIIDLKSNEIKVVNNKGLETNGGAGIAAANQILDEDVEVVITGSLGPNAFEIIDRAKIKAYKCAPIAINEVLEKYKNNELEEINVSGRAHAGMGK
jgi:predicted Fe-Mo cluster-binding NifX family protein